MVDARNLKKPEKFTMKQIIILRTDLKMGKGKLVAQGAHVAVLAAEEAKEKHPEWHKQWMKEGFPKIALKAKSLEELEKAYNEALDIGLPTAIVADFGLTQLEEGTVTAVAIGPAPVEEVDKIGKNSNCCKKEKSKH